MKKLIIILAILLTLIFLVGCDSINKRCEEIAKKDLNMTNPDCVSPLGADCSCRDNICKGDACYIVDTDKFFNIKKDNQ